MVAATKILLALQFEERPKTFKTATNPSLFQHRVTRGSQRPTLEKLLVVSLPTKNDPARLHRWQKFVLPKSFTLYFPLVKSDLI